MRRRCGLSRSVPATPMAGTLATKLQFRAQHDSLSLSPAHDSTSLFPNFRALGSPFPLGGLIFAPAFTRERMNAGHLLQSSPSSRFTAGAAGVFELEAVRRSSGSGRRVLALRHHAFQAHLAAWANTTFFSGEEKRVPGPARAQGPRTRQSHLSLGRSQLSGPRQANVSLGPSLP